MKGTLKTGSKNGTTHASIMEEMGACTGEGRRWRNGWEGEGDREGKNGREEERGVREEGGEKEREMEMEEGR